MPLVIPEGVIAVPEEDKQLLSGSRVTEFRYDLLARREIRPGVWSNEAVIGTLGGVQPGGSLHWSASASVKGGGSITVNDLGEGIDWLNVRIRPWVKITGPNGDFVEGPLGVFLPTATPEEWTDQGRVWEIQLLDKSSILDQDVVGDPVTGVAPTYSLPKGANAIQAVVDLIEDAGEPAPAIQEDPSATLAGPMTWDAGTTRLKVINDLLDAANYFSLWVDEHGQFQASKYSAPQYRAPRFLELRLFEKGETSVVAPDWTREIDLYSVPNRVVAIQQGDSEEEGLIAVATNTNPDSPFSFDARSRWITAVYDQVEAVDQTALDAYAQRMLAMRTSVTGGATINHLFIPSLRVNDVIRFRSDPMNALCTVDRIEMDIDPLGLCSTRISEVVAV